MKKCLDRLFFLLLYSFCPVFNAQFYTACLLLHKTPTQRADFFMHLVLFYLCFLKHTDNIFFPLCLSGKLATVNRK